MSPSDPLHRLPAGFEIDDREPAGDEADPDLLIAAEATPVGAAVLERLPEAFEEPLVVVPDDSRDSAHPATQPTRRRGLFELQYSPEWGVDRRFFLDVEHRYAKSHRLLLEAMSDLSRKRILDLGCSRGMLLERFRAYEGVEFVAIELDPEIREIARARGIETEAHQINVFEGGQMCARLPYDDASVDVVLAAEIIEHIVDTQGFVGEIARVLRPGGAVLLSTPNVLWWKYRLDLVRGRYPDLLDYRLRYGEDFGHVRIFTPALLRELVEEAGLEVVRVAGKRLGSIGSLTRLPVPVARFLDALATRWPKLSDDVMLVARKPQP